jgi:PST family polysaccharide transporter
MLRYLINFFSKLGVDVISRLLSLVTLPIIARTLGPDGYGLYAYLSVLVGYFGFFLDLGYYIYGTSEICRTGNSVEVVDDIISLQAVVLVVTMAVLVISGLLFFDTTFLVLVLISAFTLVVQPMLITHYYIANKKLYHISLAQLIGQVLFVISVVTLYINTPSLLLLVVLTQAAGIITALIMFVPYVRKNGLHLRLRFSALRATISKVYRLGIASKLEAVTTSITPLILGAWLSSYELGVYSAAFKIFILLFASVQSLQQTIMPLIFKKQSTKDVDFEQMSLLFYLNVAFGVVFGVAVFLCSPLIITILYGEKFIDAIIVLRFFSLAIALWPTHSFILTMLIALKRHTSYLITTITYSAFAVIISMVFIPVFKLTGAMLVLPITAVTGICTSLFFVHKSTKQENLCMWQLFDSRPTRELIAKLVFNRG